MKKTYKDLAGKEVTIEGTPEEIREYEKKISETVAKPMEPAFSVPIIWPTNNQTVPWFKSDDDALLDTGLTVRNKDVEECLALGFFKKHPDKVVWWGSCPCRRCNPFWGTRLKYIHLDGTNTNQAVLS